MRGRPARGADRQRGARARAEAAAHAEVGQDVGAERMLLGMLARDHLDRVIRAVSKALLAPLAALRVDEGNGRPPFTGLASHGSARSRPTRSPLIPSPASGEPDASGSQKP